MPSLSGQRGGTKNAKRIHGTLFIVTLIVLYYILYRIQIKYGVLLEISINNYMSAFAVIIIIPKIIYQPLSEDRKIVTPSRRHLASLASGPCGVTTSSAGDL